MGRFEWVEFKNKETEEASVDETNQAEISTEYGADQYIHKADKAFEVGAYHSALRYYSRALNQNNNLKAGWMGKILCLLGLGQYDDAIIWADKALEFCMNDPDLIAAKALALNRLGLKAEAFSLSDQSLCDSGMSWFCWITRGDIVLNDNSDNAEYCFLKAVEFTRDDWLPYMMIGA